MTKLTEYLHTAEAAEYIGVHHNTIRKWAGRGDIPMYRNPANGYRLFKRSDMQSASRNGCAKASKEKVGQAES